MKKAFVAALWLVTGLGLMAQADTIKLKDGRQFEGQVIKKDARTVTFDVRRSGAVFTMDFNAADVDVIIPGPIKEPPPASAPAVTPVKSADTKVPVVAAVAKPAASMPAVPACPPIKSYSTPTYYVIPLRGEVGKTILANTLKQSLEDAIKRQPTVVVLEIDSPGGLVKEAMDIIDLIREYNDKLRIVIYSNKSFSAAAVLSFTAKEIYFKPGGLMGAATSFVPDNLFLPEKIEEKMQSVWRAAARSAAEAGAHDPFIVQAMIENKVDLYQVEQNGRKRTVESKEPPSGGTLICHGGNVLTMTAAEAVDYGVASGVAENYEALGKLMGLDGWQECQGWGALLAKHWQDTWSKLDEEMKRIEKDFRKQIEAANRARPEQGQYRYYANSGNLDPKSREKWQSQALECVTHLRAAVKDLQEALDLTQGLDQLKTWREATQDLLERLKAEADDIYKKSGRTNIIE